MPGTNNKPTNTTIMKATKRFEKLINKLADLNVPFLKVNHSTVELDIKYFSYELHSSLIANYHFILSEKTFIIQTL